MAKKQKYQWRIGEKPPIIDDHSKVKLDIIAAYVAKYLEIYFQNLNARNLKLSIVDGFAGGGLYQDDIKGSPIRILESIQQAKMEIAFKRDTQNMPPFSLNIDYFFVEKCKNTFNFLSKTLNDFGYKSDNIITINDAFENKVDEIILKIQQKSRSERCIFILDQYGYMDATIATVKKIFTKMKNAEIILTFSTDSLIDYLTVDRPQTLLNLGLTKEDAEYILNLTDDDDCTRAKLQPILFQSIVQASGALHYTPFFIRSAVSNRSYWLFHFSTVAKARDEMTKLHWQNHNTSVHYGSAGLNMLGYNHRFKESLFGDVFLFDQTAKEKSIAMLKNELPEIIFNQKSIVFSDLVTKVINHTPATIDMLKESLNEHVSYGEIIVKSEEGITRKKSSSIKHSDRITTPYAPQKRFYFPN